MLVKCFARLEKMFKKEYEIPDNTNYTKDQILKSILTDLAPLKKQGFIITNLSIIDSGDLFNKSEEVFSEFTSVSD